MKKTKDLNKKKMRVGAQTKAQRGITLIALVITIIVMLILVAVTISMAVNGGLFDYAGKAVGETQNAINDEQLLAEGKVQVDGVWYDSIDDYIAGNPSALHDWTRSGDTFTCSHCNVKYTMGEYVDYTAAGKASTKITAAKSGMDYDQTIDAQDVYWIVLGIEDTDGDGRNETLLLTSETDLWLDKDDGYGIEFYGAAGYNNAVDEINRICKELYSNSEYGEARGMTIEDVNATLNYTPHGGQYYDSSDDTCKTTGNLTTKLKDIPTWDNIRGNYQTPDGTNTPEAFGEYELDGYYYYLYGDTLNILNDVNSDTSSITNIERTTIFGTYTVDNGYSNSYWLASRGVYAYSDCANFGPGGVGDGVANSCNDFFDSDGDEYDGNAGLRPVVSLKSKLPELMPTISFTYRGIEYTVPNGITWEEWNELPSCPYEFKDSPDIGGGIQESGEFVLYGDGTKPEMSDEIISGENYRASGPV